MIIKIRVSRILTREKLSTISRVWVREVSTRRTHSLVRRKDGRKTAKPRGSNVSECTISVQVRGQIL